MYRFGDFTSRANTAINLAIKISGELGHTYVGSEHLLWGLCGEGSGVAYCALQARHVSAGQLSELLVRTIGRGSPVSLTPDDLTPRSRRILERAAQQARKNGCALAGTEHILASILAERESFAVRFLEEGTLEEGEYFCLFDYSRRNPLNKNARILSLPAKEKPQITGVYAK